MKHKFLYQKLATYRSVDPDLWQSLSDTVRSIKYEANEVLLDIDHMPRRIYYIKSGGVLGYRWNKDDPTLFRIWKPGELILHIEQDLAMQRNDMQIMAAQDTVTLELEGKEVEILREKYPQMNFYFDQFTAGEIRYWQDRSFWFQISDTKQRYYETVDLYGELFTNLTDKIKGSYIGATDRWIRNLK